MKFFRSVPWRGSARSAGLPGSGAVHCPAGISTVTKILNLYCMAAWQLPFNHCLALLLPAWGMAQAINFHYYFS